MTHRNQDTAGFDVLQGAISKGDETLLVLLQYRIQRVIEEIAAFLDADSYERTERRNGYGIGFKPEP